MRGRGTLDGAPGRRGHRPAPGRPRGLRRRGARGRGLARGFADYRTPVAGLYLCGAGTHPGGGVTGANGRNCAREVLRDVKGGR